MESVAYEIEIAQLMIEAEKNKKVREGMKKIVDLYENAGFLPSLTDWEQMSDEERCDEANVPYIPD